MKPLIALPLAIVALLIGTSTTLADDAWHNVNIAPVVQNGGNLWGANGHVGVDESDSSGNLIHSMPGTTYAQVLRYCGGKLAGADSGIFMPTDVAGAALEIYPYTDPIAPDCSGNGYDPQAPNAYGGLRVVVSGFPYHANDGAYSAALGLISNPQQGNGDVGSLNGYLCHSGANQPPSCPNGAPAADGTYTLSWFGQVTVTNRSSTGYPVASFASWANRGGSGYYTSGPLLDAGDGTTVLYLAGHRCTVHVGSWGGRLDFNLDDAWLGHRDMCA